MNTRAAYKGSSDDNLHGFPDREVHKHSTGHVTHNHNSNISKYTYMYMFLMRDEKEQRKKQARSNKHKANQHSTCTSCNTAVIPDSGG